MYICNHIHIHIYVYVYIYIYTHILRPLAVLILQSILSFNVEIRNPNSLQAPSSFIGDLPQGGRHVPSYCCHRLFGPSKDAPKRAGDPAKHVARKKKPSVLDVLPQIPCRQV